MHNTVSPVPTGYHSVTPYLVIAGADEAIAFYSKAFGARELVRMDGPGNKVGHAELQIGDSMVMLADEYRDMGARAPRPGGGSPISLVLYVEDVDGVVERALAAGAKVLRAIENKFYGDRSGQLEDPFGHIWTVATHIEDVLPEEMKRRMAALAPSG